MPLTRCALRPGYLSYFTPFVRSTESYRLLTDSNLDWGQGLLALRDYQRNHPGEPIALSYFGSIDPALYGIQSNELGSQHVSGTVVVSATNLSGQFLADPEQYRWLLQQKPVRSSTTHSMFLGLVTGLVIMTSGSRLKAEAAKS